MPAFVAYKAHMRSLFGAVDGDVLDVGCGVGNDVRDLGACAIGLDPSRTMLGVAAPRGGRYVCGTVEHLPIRLRSLAGVQADRVLQHVVDPDAAIAALVELVRPGGVIVVADPDQSTLAIDGPDPALTDVVRRYRAEHGIRHGFLPARMTALFEANGLIDIAQSAWTMDQQDPAKAFGITTWSGFLVELGWFGPAQAAQFDESLRAAGDDGTFSYRVDIVVTWGRVP